MEDECKGILSHVCVLHAYPISTSFRDKLEKRVGAKPHYVSIADLRAPDGRGIFPQLRLLRPSILFLPMERDGDAAFLPVLKILAAFSRAAAIRVVTPEMGVSEVFRLEVIPAATRCVYASLVGLWAMWRCQCVAFMLLQKARIDAVPGKENRILYLMTVPWQGARIGGAIAHYAGVVNGFLNRRIAVNVVSTAGETMLSPEADVTVLPVIQPLALPVELNLYRGNFDAFRRVRPVAVAHRYRFIYHRMSLGNFTGVAVSRRFRLPLVLEYNGSEVWIAENWGTPLRFARLARQAELICLRHAHLIVTVSEVLRNDLINRGVESERVICEPNGVDATKFDPSRFSLSDKSDLRRHLGIAQDAFVVTFVGTFGRWHGTDVFAEAIRLLVGTEIRWLSDHKVHFLFVGDGLMRSEVERSLGGEDCRPFCTFVGLLPQEETPAFLAISDVCVSPHAPDEGGGKFFGSPTKLFEYLSMGKPVIASDLGQIGEILVESPHAQDLPTLDNDGSPTSRGCGVLTRPGQVVELVEAIRFIVKNREWARVAGGRSRELVLENYTWDHHVARISDRIAAMWETEHSRQEQDIAPYSETVIDK